MSSSPWGTVQDVRTVCRGVAWVSTAGHGGLRVSKGFAFSHLTDAARKRAQVYGGYLFYEEDCNFAIPAFELSGMWGSMFPTMAKEEVKPHLMLSLSSWNPEYLLERGIEPMPEQYKAWQDRQKGDRMRAERHPDLIVSASRINTDVTQVTTADHKTHYVTAESYRARSGLNLLSKCAIVERPEGENG